MNCITRGISFLKPTFCLLLLILFILMVNLTIYHYFRSFRIQTYFVTGHKKLTNDSVGTSIFSEHSTQQMSTLHASNGKLTNETTHSVAAPESLKQTDSVKTSNDIYSRTTTIPNVTNSGDSSRLNNVDKSYQTQQTFTVMVHTKSASTVLQKSTIWNKIGCTKPHCKVQDISLSQKSISHLMAAEHDIRKGCAEPKESFIEADKSTADLVNLTKTIKCDLGGRWRPSGCRPIQKVALMIPYRNRTSMLGTWLRHMHWFLQKQNIEYGIYVVEQDEDAPFNRALLFNIAAKFAMTTDDYDCLINHDVDQLPVNLQNSYTCDKDPKKVTHYARNVSCRTDKIWEYHFGMVSSLTPYQFLSVNGYSNLYFGWGAEDDDMSIRLRNFGYKFTLRSKETGAYVCLRHAKADQKNDREKFKQTAKNRLGKDGYNTMSYNVLAYSKTPLFTWIYAHIDKEKVRSRFHETIKGDPAFEKKRYKAPQKKNIYKRVIQRKKTHGKHHRPPPGMSGNTVGEDLEPSSSRATWVFLAVILSVGILLFSLFLYKVLLVNNMYRESEVIFSSKL